MTSDDARVGSAWGRGAAVTRSGRMRLRPHTHSPLACRAWPWGHRSARGFTMAVAMACPVFLVSCKVGPDYQRPDAAVNEAWQTEASPGAINVLWWETLNDSTLTSLVQMGLKQNLTLRTAGLRVL